MEADGNVWWVQILVVSSPTPKALSSTSNWRLLTFSSSKGFESLESLNIIVGCLDA